MQQLQKVKLECANKDFNGIIDCLLQLCYKFKIISNTDDNYLIEVCVINKKKFITKLIEQLNIIDKNIKERIHVYDYN